MTSHTCRFRPGPCDHTACDPSVMNEEERLRDNVHTEPALLTSDEAREYAAGVYNQVQDAVALGSPLSDDALSMMFALREWVDAVADVGGINPE